MNTDTVAGNTRKVERACGFERAQRYLTEENGAFSRPGAHERGVSASVPRLTSLPARSVKLSSPEERWWSPKPHTSLTFIIQQLLYPLLVSDDSLAGSFAYSRHQSRRHFTGFRGWFGVTIRRALFYFPRSMGDTNFNLAFLEPYRTFWEPSVTAQKVIAPWLTAS